MRIVRHRAGLFLALLLLAAAAWAQDDPQQLVKQVTDQTLARLQTERAALKADPRIKNSEGAEFDPGPYRVMFANSQGFAGEYNGTSYSLSAVPIAQDESGMQIGYWYTSNRKYAALDDAEEIGRIAAAIATSSHGSSTRSAHSARASAGRIPARSPMRAAAAVTARSRFPPASISATGSNG